MPKNKHPGAEELYAVLARQWDILRIEDDPSSPGRITISFLMDGAPHTASLTLHSLPPVLYESPNHQGDAVFLSRPSWSDLDLAEQGLPPYWSRNWLLRQLMAHANSVDQVALAFGQDKGEVARFRTLHGIENATQEVVRLRWLSGEFATQKDLAAALGLSTSTVHRYVGQLRHPDSERFKQIARMVKKGLSHEQMLERLGAGPDYAPRLRYITSRLQSASPTGDVLSSEDLTE